MRLEWNSSWVLEIVIITWPCCNHGNPQVSKQKIYIQKSRMNGWVSELPPWATLLSRSGLDKWTFWERSRGPLAGFLKLKNDIMIDVIPVVFTVWYGIHNCQHPKLVCSMSHSSPSYAAIKISPFAHLQCWNICITSKWNVAGLTITNCHPKCNEMHKINMVHFSQGDNAQNLK